MLILNRRWIYILPIILFSYISLGQDVKNFHFEGRQELAKSRYVPIDQFLFPDNIEITYPKGRERSQKIAYQDIYKVQIEASAGKEILKDLLIGGLVGFMIFASLPPDFLYCGGGSGLVYWKSPIIITMQSGTTYKLYVGKNHILQKRINQLCADAKFKIGMI